MGLDLIPPVDNIHTFDTTLDVETYNKIFSFADDSARSIYSDEQFLGVLTDPIFGKTDAQMFFQLVPENGKSTFKNVPGKRYIDSVVLVVRHLETYGDTTLPMTISVSELSTSNNFKASGTNRDSAYSVRENNFITSRFLGSKEILPSTLNDSILDIRGQDTVLVANQIRIKLDNDFGQRLLDYDTTGVNDAYSTDSIFLTKVGGFALKSIGGGNALLGLYLSDTSTKLAVYYRYDNTTTAGDIDTAVANFVFSPIAATANYIGRDYQGTDILSSADDNVQDPFVYIQNTPGTYATIKIPGLSGMNNSVIHLAELQMEQVYDPLDTVFSSPPMLFIDMYNNNSNKYTTIPYVIDNMYLAAADASGTYYTISSAGYGAMGAYYFYKEDPFSNRVKEWKFNLTRYVQHVVKGDLSIGDLRLYTTNEFIVENGNPNSSSTKIVVQTTNGPAKSRVRLGGGNNLTQKMKLRIVYSKL